MTDTRKEFQKWWNIEKKNPIPDYGQESLTYDIAFHGWQACQSLNDKRIQQLLAVIDVQREALRKICRDADSRAYAEQIADESLAIKPENVELVEVGSIRHTGTGSIYLGGFIDELKDGQPVYTIKTKD